MIMYKSLYDIRIDHAALVDELIDSEGELSPELEINQTKPANKIMKQVTHFIEVAQYADKSIKHFNPKTDFFIKMEFGCE
jgi:hypothetical protein